MSQGMNTQTKTVTLLLFATVVFSATLTQSQTTTIDDAQNAINQAYQAILKANNNGANTNQLTDQLNTAINLTTQAKTTENTNPQQTQTLAAQAQTIAQDITKFASTAQNQNPLQQPIIVAPIVAALIATGSIVYLYGPKAYWKTWLKLRKNYKIKTKNTTTAQNNNKETIIITAEQICAVVLGITIIIAFIAASPFFLPKGTGEQFSELGILGSNMKLGDYPSNIVAGDTIHLYVYVGNQMNQPMYYTIQVKLGNNQTNVDPAPTTPVQQFTQIVPKNGTWVFPLNMTLTQPGQNQRIIFELWTYNQTLNQNQYDNRWTQVWLNVTAPAT
jgi:hypothetical protein